jgi:hypothetical protein
VRSVQCNRALKYNIVFMLSCLIVSKTERLAEKYIGHKVYVSFFSAVLVQNVFCHDKYVLSYITDTHMSV